MNRGQRRRHEIVWLILAPLLVAILVTALAYRPDAPAAPREAIFGEGR
ncbi:MAG: hypothetical protein R3F20_15395 [Planctomycetota bacterium]